MARSDSSAHSGGPAAHRPAGLLTGRFARLLLAQTAFSFGWSIYLLAPKFYATALSASAGEIGRISAMGGLCSVLATPLAIRAIDGESRKGLFYTGTGTLAVLSLAFMALTDSRSLGFFYVVQGMVGVSFVMAFNAVATLATDEAPPERLGQALGLIGASNMVMNAVSTSLAEHISLTYGWRPVFALGLIGAVLATSVLAGHREAARDQHGQQQSPLPLRALSLPLTASLLTGITFAAMFIFHQPYALSLGATEIRDFFLGFTGSAIVVRLFFGNLGDRFGHQAVARVAAIGYGLSCGSMVLLEPSNLWLHGAMFGLAHGVLYPTLNAVTVQRAPAAARGRAMTLYSSAYSVGIGASSLLWGEVAERFGYVALFTAGASIGMLSAALLSVRQRPSLAAPAPVETA